MAEPTPGALMKNDGLQADGQLLPRFMGQIRHDPGSGKRLQGDRLHGRSARCRTLEIIFFEKNI